MYHTEFLEEKKEAMKCIQHLQLHRFRLFAKIAQVTFLWPAHNEYKQSVGRIFSITYLVAVFSSTLIKLFQELKKDNVDSNTVVECALQISVYFRHLQGYIFISINFDMVLKCLAIMNHIFQNNSELGQKIIMHRVDKALNLSTLQSVAFILMCISYIITPLAFQSFLSWIFPEQCTFQKNLPLKLSYLVDENKYFYHIFMLQILIAFWSSLLMCVFSHYYCFVIGFIIGDIRCLQHYMKGIDYQFDLRVFTIEETKKDWICSELKFIIHHHHNLLQLHKLAQKLLSSIFLVLLMGIAFDLVLIGTWMVILLDREVIEALKMIMAFLIVQLTVFTMCIPSQLMSNASYDLFVQNYSTNWYKYPPQARRMLVLLIAGTTRNFEIKAGPIFIMTFETCSSIFQGSMSYIATFKTMYTAFQ